MSELVQFIEPENQEPSGEQDSEIVNLGSRLKSQYQEYKDARKETENGWLKDLRQFNAIYEPDVLARLQESGARSKVFVGLTRTKVMAAYSRIIDLLFQHGDAYFAVQATEVPQIDPVKAMQLREAAQMQMIQASGLDPAANQDIVIARMKELEGEFKEVEKKMADAAAEKMTSIILDQLQDVNAEQKLKESIMESCIFGSGAIKAGTVRIDRKKSYSKVMDPNTGKEAFALSQIEQPAPDLETVSIFDLYPDPYCTSLDDCDGLYRRHVLTKRQFRELANLPGFDAEIVKYILKHSKEGNHQEEDHERSRRKISGINEQGESGRYEVLEYWGNIDGHELKEEGFEFEEGADLSEDFSVCIWICKDKILKIMLNPISGYKIPYMIFPYEKSPHAFWGTGVPSMMRDSQTTMNAATRIWIDNMALSSGPLVEVNTDLLADGEDPTDIHPWRVFLRSGGDGSMPAVRFYQPIANANGLNQIVELFRRFADETTSLPSYTHGEQTRSLNKTATGISMLMGAANVALKSTIKNIDDFLLEPMVESLFHYNMEFGLDEEAKGDLKIVPRGSTALVQKEVQSQRLLQFLSLVSNPMDAALVDRGQLLKDIAKSMDIDPDEILKSTEQLQAEQQALQNQAIAGASQGGPMAENSAPMGPPPNAPM